MILLYNLTLISLATLICSVVASPISSGKENPIETKQKVITLVEYDAKVHGPSKAFRMAINSPQRVVIHPNGLFNHEAHLEEMNRIVSRENANNKRQIEGEIAYESQPHDVRLRITKRQNDHERRASSLVSFNLGINYRMQLYTTLPFGTPPQMIPLDIDFSISHTLIPSSCFNSNSPILQRRDSVAPVCPVTSFGFDMGKSTSASIVPGLYYDTDYVTDSGLGKRSITGLPVQLVTEVITIASVLVSVSFYYFRSQIYARLQSGAASGGGGKSVAAAGTGVLGLGAGGITPPIKIPRLVPIMKDIPAHAGAVLTQLYGTAVAISDGYHDWNTYNDLLDITVGLVPDRKRASSSTSTAQLIFGGADRTKYVGSFIFFPVVGTVGFTQKLLWQLTLKSIQIGSTSKLATWSSIRATPSGKQSGVSVISIQNPIQFDPSHPWIYFSLAIVDSIYVKIPGYRRPTPTNPYYSFYCRNSPSISFEFTDTTGTPQLLTMSQRTWIKGLALDSIGYCNGAIQPLPSGATLPSLGSSFFQSFCTALGTETETRQADIIGLAVTAQPS